MTSALTTADVVFALQQDYAHEAWLSFAELRVGTGFGKDAHQRLDFWCMHLLPSGRFRRIAYEIKISRADFLKEVRNPVKRRRALLLSNEFYFIAPQGLIHPSEIPPEAGLAEVFTINGTYHISVEVPAPWRDTVGPSWQFLAAVARRAARSQVPEEVLP